MINKVYQDFTNDKYNKENNYNVIIAKTRKTKKMFKFSHAIAASFMLLIIGLATPAIYAQISWNIEFKDYQYRPTETATGSLQQLKDSDYAEVIDMDYLVQDGIGVRVDEILMTNNCFDANITFKFPKDMVINANGFDFGYAVYDENNNIYSISDRIGANKKLLYRTPFIFKELGVKCKNKNYPQYILSDNGSFGLLASNEADKTITNNITLRAKDSYPKSKKIFIRVYNLGYRAYDWNEENIRESQIEIFDISDKEWIFEIDVPEKFQNSTTLELVVPTDIPGFEFEEITISESSLILNFKSQKYFETKTSLNKEERQTTDTLLYVTDGSGNTYKDIVGSLSKDNCKLTYDIGKQVLQEKGLFLNITLDGQTYTTELIEK